MDGENFSSSPADCACFEENMSETNESVIFVEIRFVPE